MREVLLSVGIDIGTSTTQVIFSSITVEDMSSGFSAPRVEIIGKEIIYKGKIYFTPLLTATEIDMEGVREIVRAEYASAGVDKSKLKTGAVVITGETARKRNANEVVRQLSEFAGDFVVATAGPDLESIIAACGAGADVYSRAHSTMAANFDIGGGTSNFALYGHGKLLCTGCLDIGGRLVKIDDSRITYIAPKIAGLCKTKGIQLALGDFADEGVLRQIVRAMTELLEMSLGLREKSEFYPKILTVPGRDIELPASQINICFSGGVADDIYRTEPNRDIFRYGDIGVLLGQAIRDSRVLSALNRFTPKETVRATVVGAGSHITEISGSTIDYDAEVLPLKNIPILKLSAEEEQPGKMAEAISKKLEWFRVDGELQSVAVSFTGRKSAGFHEVGLLADALLAGTKPLLDLELPLLVISESDMAKVLGQSIRSRMKKCSPLVCIDAVKAEHGDYADIGMPIAGGRVLPVVVKTLLFT